MAKKRLNKKVVLIGSLVFVFLALAAIATILYLSRSPEKFIKDGDAALQAAREAIDEQVKEEHYKTAERNYHRARGLARTDSLRVEMLFKLMDVYLETGQWRNVLGCWNGVVQIDPKNIKARYGRLKYLYIMADSGINQVWSEVASQASELIEVVEDADLLMENTAKWESFPVSEEVEQAQGQLMGPYLYLLRGRAHLRMARLGAVTNPDESLALATNDLQKVQELQLDNIDAYWYLAQAAVTKGEILASRGNLEERDKSLERAKKLLEDAVEIADSDVRAHINLLRLKLAIALRGDAMQVRERIQALEAEHLSLVQKFPSNAEAYLELAGFYRRFTKKLDKAVEAAEKARGLDAENIVCAINAANLHYRNFSIHGQEPEIYKAIEIAEKALTLPDAQEVSGPRRWANRTNRISLYGFLANCYIEQVLATTLRGAGLEAPQRQVQTATESAQRQKWLARAEEVVHEIEQLYGSGEEPQVVEWQGMLELARGNKNSAIRKLYATYQQLKAASKRPELERVDSLLAYRLAKVFENTTELGAANEFFRTALRLDNRGAPGKIDETKPEALLDYADLLLKVRDYGSALSVVNFFEGNYWTNERSQTLQLGAYIGAKQFDRAQEKLSRRKPDDPNTIKLKLALQQAKIEQVQKAIKQKQTKESLPILLEGGQVDAELESNVESMAAELRGYSDTLAELAKKLLEIEPNSVEEASIAIPIGIVCDNYIADGQTSTAKDLVNQWLECSPDNVTALFYKELLSEPEPDKISQQRRNEIRVQVLSEITDPIQRSVNLGVFYQVNNEPNKAAEEFKKVLSSHLFMSDKPSPSEGLDEKIPDAQPPQAPPLGGAGLGDPQRIAASYLFEIALEKQDWELAERISELARRENLDKALGTFFAARLAAAKGQFKDALAKLEECLKQRPVFSAGYLLRSQINDALGSEHSAIEDARKAASLNPLNGAIAKKLAVVLYKRNKKLGDNATSSQILEAQTTLIRAIALNRGTAQLQLSSLYAEYISPTEPSRALAIRQYLQKIAPSMENARLLGKLATKIATGQTDAKRKEALFDIAASSFEQARKIDPQDKGMLYDFSEYHRARGQEGKAEQLLEESKDPKMLWGYYFRGGQFENARKVLEQLYQSEAKDSSVVKGLLLIAEKTDDKEAAKKYSEEILSLEDNIENHLMQIYTFLKVGLVKEAEHKLESFKEKFPDEPRALLFDAWLAMKQGRLKKALELTNRNLETNEDDAEAWRLRGEINLRLANYDQAIIDLKKSKSLVSEPLTQFSLAKAYLGAGREEDAITEFENMIDHPQAPMQARGLLERIYLQLRRGEELKRFYEKTLKKFPDSPLWHNQAAAFAAATGNLNMAEQLYKQALQKAKKGDGSSMISLDGYLRVLGLGGKLDKVLEEGGKYVDSDSAPMAYLRMAEAKLKLGDKASAIQYCRSAVDKASGDETFMLDTLKRMYLLVEAGEVFRYCKEKLEADPNSLAANMAMFNLMKINGEYNKALGYIDKCLEVLEPGSLRRIAYTGLKTEVLHLTYMKTSDKNYLNSAIAEYESLLAKMPNNTSILNNLAYMLAESNERLDKALEYARRAHEAQPNNPDLMDTYGYVLYKNSKYSEAAELLQAAIQQFESEEAGVPVEAYEHLGQANERLGAKTEALAAYKQALQIMSSDKLWSKAANERVTSAIERLSMQEEDKQ